MSSDLPDFSGDFLDDFYVECDELLGNIRMQLTQFADAGRDTDTHPAAFEALYRHVHTFKGSCAIVGLREAEQLAHAAEDLLRLFSRGATAAAPEHLVLLAHVTERLEQIVAAHRLGGPLPGATDLLAQLSVDDRGIHVSESTAPAPATRQSGEAAPLPPPATRAGHRWQASFAPSAELDQRGVNINSVRARFAALGRILSAAPAIHPGGKMSFEFQLLLHEAPGDPGGWQADGISLQTVAPGSTPDDGRDTPPSAAPASMFVAPSHVVRVDLSRLDELMRIAGEMVIQRSRLDDRIVRIAGDRSGLQEVSGTLGRSLRQLREAVTRVRLVPISEIFGRLPFVVRDLAGETGKKVRLVVDGQETEIDKYLVERLKEPLLHLVRNAISHGVERPEERSRAGKPAEATLSLRAAASGQGVVIQIRDDGRGMDTEKIIARAARLGITMSDTPSGSELLRVISRPGFSTRDEVDRTAGRGVGMDVVHRTVRDLAGSITLESEPGQWTQFTLRLPLTLSIAETFLVSAGGQTCAVPQPFVEEVLQFSETDVHLVQNVEVIAYREGVLPLVRLHRLFGADAATAVQHPLLVLGSERGFCGLVVDRVLGQREVVVRAMQDPLIQVPGVSGATELGDGRPVLILDPIAFSTGAVRPRHESGAMSVFRRREPVPMAAPAPGGRHSASHA